MNYVNDDSAEFGESRTDRRSVRLSINTSFAEEIGADGLRTYVDTLVDIAERQRGGDAPDITQALRQGWDSAGISVPEIEVVRLAEQLADPARADVVIALDDGTVLYGDDRSGDGGESSAPQPEPEDPDRPVYS